MNENGEQFKKELAELCAKYNVAIFAGFRGLMFNFMNEADKENSAHDYYSQNLETKELIVYEESKR